jgi:hypothetical protein
MDVENTTYGDDVMVTAETQHAGGFASHAAVANLGLNKPYTVDRVERFYANITDKRGDPILLRANVYLQMFPGRRFNYLCFANCKN